MGAFPLRTLFCLALFVLGGTKKTPYYDNHHQPYYRPEYGPGKYHSYQMIEDEVKVMRDTQEASPFVQVYEEAYSSGGKPVSRVVMTNKLVKTKKIKALLLYGVHARELISSESFFWLHANLTRSMDMSPSTPEGKWARYVLDNMELHAIPLLNPDGVIYMEQNKEYCWRWDKNGVDLNRNFDWQFGGKGSTHTPGTEEWHGKKAFSEPEAAYIRDLLTGVKGPGEFDYFLDMHSGEQQIFSAFVDTKSHREHATRAPMISARPQTDEELDLINYMVDQSCDDSSACFFKQSGIAWKYNSYGADGTTFDYAAGVGKVPFSLCVEVYGMELRYGNIDCFVQFNPPNENLQETLDEISVLYWAGFEFLIKRLRHITLAEYDPTKTLSRSLSETEARLTSLMQRLDSIRV